MVFFNSSNSFPAPSATHVNGVSDINIGTFKFVSSISTIPFNNAPPPVNTIPFSIISADNSGGEFSKILVIFFFIFLFDSF